jgi:hypothetical protein
VHAKILVEIASATCSKVRANSARFNNSPRLTHVLEAQFLRLLVLSSQLGSMQIAVQTRR